MELQDHYMIAFNKR